MIDQIRGSWNLIKETIRNEYDLSDISFSTWIEPLQFADLQDDMVVILIPSDQSHALNYISSKYKNYFKVTISEMFDHTYDVKFILEKDKKQQPIYFGTKKRVFQVRISFSLTI